MQKVYSLDNHDEGRVLHAKYEQAFLSVEQCRHLNIAHV